jgi:membrane protein YdbS with pleckstrin-like domain
MKQLHPGARWAFRIRSYFSLIVLGIILAIWAGTFFSYLFGGVGIVGSMIFILVAIVIVAEIYARLAYRFWFYEFAKDQLRIERGIIWKRYTNIPYERVQNVDIQRGIIARLLGFSSVNIQTAGYSMPAQGYGQGSEGFIPAVSKEEGEKIREFLMKKISRKRSGL